MKDYGVLVLSSIVLSFLIVGTTSALNENLTLGHFSISFNVSEKAPFAKTCKGPTRIATVDGIGMTSYQCGLRNSTGGLLAFTIGQYDVNRASKLEPHVSDKDTKLWLEGLIWKIQTNLTFGSTLRGWSASSWLNDKTTLIIDGTYPEKELDRIRNTLSVKENGTEIYMVRQ